MLQFIKMDIIKIIFLITILQNYDIKIITEFLFQLIDDGFLKTGPFIRRRSIENIMLSSWSPIPKSQSFIHFSDLLTGTSWASSRTEQSHRPAKEQAVPQVVVGVGNASTGRRSRHEAVALLRGLDNDSYREPEASSISPVSSTIDPWGGER